LYSLKVQLARSVEKGQTNLDHTSESQIVIGMPLIKKKSKSQPQTVI